MIQFDPQTAKLQTIPFCLFDLHQIDILARDRALHRNKSKTVANSGGLEYIVRSREAKLRSSQVAFRIDG